MVFHIHLLFCVSNDGGRVSNYGCSFKIAVGKDVAVNLIITLPFLNGLQSKVDFETNTLETPTIEHMYGFKIHCRRAELRVHSSSERLAEVQ